MLPVVLLGCVWWSHGRLDSRDWVRTAPFFALSVLLGLTTVWFQYHRAMSGQEVRVGGVSSRVAVAGLAPWFYLSKAVLPLDLCMVYPQWNPGTWGWSGWLPGMALAGSLRSVVEPQRLGPSFVVWVGVFCRDAVSGAGVF